MEALKSLNAEQRAAVSAAVGPVLVRAGAGSGKTRVLTLRIAYLISNYGAKPDQILALTFTNKAAREMRERLGVVLGRGGRGLTSGTFHAVCARLLRQVISGRLGSYTGDFSIYAGDEQLQLATIALETATERAPVLLEPDEVLRRISRAKSRMLTPRLMARFAPDPIERFVAGCYRRYQRALEQANAFDFDDLILVTHRLLSEQPDLLEECQARWRHVLVDEYQDTDPSQHALVELLSRPSSANEQRRSLFVVGDAMQSIYGFRNADHSIITRFNKDFPEAQIIELLTNYRSRQAILDVAYAVIRQSRVVPPMALRSAGGAVPNERCVLINEAKDGREEAEQVVRSINELQRQGRRLRDIAVLYRTRHMSRTIEQALRHARLPYSIRGSVGFYDRAVVRDALAYLRVINNPADGLSLNRIANVPARGFGQQSLAALTNFAAQHNLTPVAALGQEAFVRSLPSKAAAGARRLASLFARWQRLAAGTMPPDHLLADVLEQSGYMAALEQRFSPADLPDARAHLQELVSAAEEHTSLTTFLQEIALITATDTREDERDQVQLLTIHASKGLEWPVVFVIGLEEKTLPHERSMGSSDGIEEERRLCYVALTRAAERLYLSWAPGRNRGQRLKPSRFLNEILAYGRERAGGKALADSQ
ncbi:ATP-dependent helicase [Candidatus Viridilinea mediisalina]|uniref:DNA 3'-5' helicase n=1 Tax=Candidatus Viridilinea mediisalina TaxID=2024553 RepID=A0A2A6RPF0_9CHLR|nr:UvrD-helicase domain-containing protein [Candidatus Viridilinea mediisalina]PDW04927.1 DNA helicase UvrD [Candidatus Viridilinea mediisalina]